MANWLAISPPNSPSKKSGCALLSLRIRFGIARSRIALSHDGPPERNAFPALTFLLHCHDWNNLKGDKMSNGRAKIGSHGKVFRDAVHGLIRIEPDDAFLLDLINTPEFQRLRRVRQLGV